MLDQYSFIKLNNIHENFVFLSKPSQYGNDVGRYIFATGARGIGLANDFSPGIYEYDLNNDAMKLLHEYDDSIKVESTECSQFMVNENNTLYIFHLMEMHSFNVETKQIQRITFDEYLHIPVITYISSPLNEIHIMSESNHLKYCINTNKILIFDTPETFRYPKPIYIPFKNQLMMVGHDNGDTILYQNVNQTDDEWNSYSLKMPHIVDDTRDYDYILQFETLLFIFYFPHADQSVRISDIWILDLMNDKWYKSKYTTPLFDKLTCKIFALKGKNNSVHIIDFENGYHATQSLHNLIPKELWNVYSKYYNRLIIGYIKEMENKSVIPTIPYVLKQLICRYFPSFI